MFVPSALRSLVTTIGSGAFAVAIAGCGGSDAAAKASLEPGTYVGLAEGSDARVGVVVGATSTVAFVCGGPTSVTTATTWLRADTAPSERVALAADGRSATLEASGEGRLAGTLQREGGAEPLRFTATRVPDGSIAGLYDGRDAEGRAGVVVTSADEAQGAFIRTVDAARFQVIVIRPLAFDQDALRVTALGRDLRVRRVVAP